MFMFGLFFDNILLATSIYFRSLPSRRKILNNKKSFLRSKVQLKSCPLRNSPELQIGPGSDFADRGDAKDSDDDDSDHSEIGSLSDPIWDQLDDVFRCTVCSWEVTDGFCSACKMEFEWDVVRAALSCLLRYSQPKAH